MPRRRLTLRSIHIVTTIERRPGVAGCDITTKATAHTSAAEIDLPSSPDCAFLRDPLGLSQLSVTVSLAPIWRATEGPQNPGQAIPTHSGRVVEHE